MAEITGRAAAGRTSRTDSSHGLPARDVPSSHLWFSDREIDTSPSRSVAYTSEDYRRELARVERRMYWLTAVSLVIAVLAIIGIIGIVIQAG